MKIGEEEKKRHQEMFKTLSKSSLGKSLIDYCDYVCDTLTDSRTWKEGDTKESVNKAAEYVKKHIRDRLINPNRSVTKPQGSEFE